MISVDNCAYVWKNSKTAIKIKTTFGTYYVDGGFVSAGNFCPFELAPYIGGFLLLIDISSMCNMVVRLVIIIVTLMLLYVTLILLTLSLSIFPLTQE
jgi:hypothetical protein